MNHSNQTHSQKERFRISSQIPIWAVLTLGLLLTLAMSLSESARLLSVNNTNLAEQELLVRFFTFPYFQPLPAKILPFVFALSGLLIIFLIWWIVYSSKRSTERAALAELQIKKSEENFRQTLDLATVGIALIGMDGRWLWVNRTICHITGYSEEQLRQRTFAELTHPDDIELDWEQARRLVAGEIDSYTLEKRYKRSNGTLVWVNLTVSLKRDESGLPEYFISCINDIDEQKKLRDSERDTRLKLQMALQAGQMATWHLDLKSNKTTISAEAIRLLGVGSIENDEPENIIARIIHPEDRELTTKALTEAIQNRAPYAVEHRVVWPSGEVRCVWAQGDYIVDELGTEAYAGVLLDITERKQAEEELRYQGEITKTITDNAASCLFMMDKNGHPTFMNPAAKEVTGYLSLDEIKDRPLHYSVHWKKPDGSRYPMEECPIDNAQAELKEARNQEEMFCRKDGTLFPVSYSIKPLQRNGQIIGSVLEFRDITDQKRTEQQLEETAKRANEANELKSAFLANMSHEIRTPLGAILGFTDLLRDPCLGLKERNSYQDIVKRNGEQLSSLINDILDLSKVEAGQFKAEILSTQISDVFKEINSIMTVKAQEKGINLQCYIEENVPPVFGTDPIRLRQILTNIIGNAIKFTESGTVEVSTAQTEEGTLTITVKDSGIGITPEEAKNLFQPFSQADPSITRKYGGTGLGLVLSRKLARALGGDLILKSSEAGKGSVFEIKLPNLLTKREDLPFQKPPVLARNQNLDGIKVLLVEDSPDNQHLISRILINRGAKVEIAQNGLEGVDLVMKDNPDLVLMDIQMPIMDGYTATQTLRERGYRKPIIALTAHAMNEVRTKCFNIGCTDHMTKPLNAGELVLKISQYTEKKSG